MDEEDSCPLCISPFTAHDKQFNPCSCCGFRLCVWCWHRIVTIAESASGECPGCRTPYDLEAVRKQKVHITQPPPRRAAASRQSIADVVVLDKKVVLVENIPTVLLEMGGMREEDHLSTLRQHFLFGQYGRVLSAVIIRGRIRGSKAAASSPSAGAAEEAYHCALRFHTSEEAAAAVQGTHGAILCGNLLSAALTPTRYCNSFLMNKPSCKKVGCVELHEVAPTHKSMYVKGAVARTLSVLGPIADRDTAAASLQSQWSPQWMESIATHYHASAVAMAQRCALGSGDCDRPAPPSGHGALLQSPVELVRAEAQRLEGGALSSSSLAAVPSGSFVGGQSPMLAAVAASSTTSFGSEVFQMSPAPSSSFLADRGSAATRLDTSMKLVIAEAFTCQQAIIVRPTRRKAGKKGGSGSQQQLPPPIEQPHGMPIPPCTPAVLMDVALPHPPRGRK